MGEDHVQEAIDRFYWSKGPCCAGCDWWTSHNSVAGVCRRSAPASGTERAAMLGIYGSSLTIGSGHAFTMREHHCGDFRDQFDWSSLSLAYRKRVGAPTQRVAHP